MDSKQFDQYLAENGIDEFHEDYDNLWANFMFGGKDPNKVVEAVHDLYLAGKLPVDATPIEPYQPGHDQWFEMDGGE